MHKGARTDPCGGRGVTRAPTATKAPTKAGAVQPVQDRSRPSGFGMYSRRLGCARYAPLWTRSCRSRYCDRGLFAGFTALTAESDFPRSCIIGAPPPTRPRRAHRIPPRFVPLPRHSSDADGPHPPGNRSCHVAPKFQLYGRPYMRLHNSNVGHIVPVKSRVTRWGRRTAYDVGA
jgi:hypothetical protein